ncbi:MAG: NHL repeat-containing protein, partial [Candidatus Zixiibacteriota bacterium]
MRPPTTSALIVAAAVLVAGCASRVERSGSEVRTSSGAGMSPGADTAPLSLMIVGELSRDVLGKALKRPTAVRATSDGAIYLIDSGNQRILKLDSDFQPLAERGGLGSFKGMFHDPLALALSPTGRVYVGDAELLTVQRFDENLNVIDHLVYEDDEDALKFGRPNGLVIGRDDELWVIDRDANRIAVFDRFHSFKEFVADYNSGGVRLERPGAAMNTPGAYIAVCDEQAGRVVVYDEFGSERFTFGEKLLREPSDIACDASGRYWITDRTLDEALCFSGEGQLL